MDIVELQKEINELQLENRIIKAKMPIHFGDQQSGIAGKNDNNPYVILFPMKILFVKEKLIYYIYKTPGQGNTIIKKRK